MFISCSSPLQGRQNAMAADYSDETSGWILVSSPTGELFVKARINLTKDGLASGIWLY